MNPLNAIDHGPKTGRILRMPDVVAELKISQATINRLHRTGQFPPKVQLTERCTGWWEGQIEAWKRARPGVSEKN